MSSGSGGLGLSRGPTGRVRGSGPARNVSGGESVCRRAREGMSWCVERPGLKRLRLSKDMVSQRGLSRKGESTWSGSECLSGLSAACISERLFQVVAQTDVDEALDAPALGPNTDSSRERYALLYLDVGVLTEHRASLSTSFFVGHVELEDGFVIPWHEEHVHGSPPSTVTRTSGVFTSTMFLARSAM